MADHSKREHSIFSMSAFDRWTRCPASALFTKDMPNEPGPAALRGTWLHEQTEACFIASRTGREYTLPEVGWDGKPVKDEDAQAMKDALAALYRIIKDHGGLNGMNLFVEAPVRIIPPEGMEDPECWGTSDITLIDQLLGTVITIDFKFGHNPVDPERNGQLRSYAVAVAHTYNLSIPDSTFYNYIIQPIYDDPVRFEMVSGEELAMWYAKELLPPLMAANNPDAEFIPGEKQCKWCPAAKNHECKARNEKNRELFDTLPVETYTLPNDQLIYWLDKLPMIEDACDKLRQLALSRAKSGTPLKGHKVVRKITHKKWADEKKAESFMAARKLPKDQRYKKPALISPSAAEKLLKPMLADNPRLQTNFGKLVTRPEGALTIAPETDKRPAVTVDNPLLNDNLEI